MTIKPVNIQPDPIITPRKDVPSKKSVKGDSISLGQSGDSPEMFTRMNTLRSEAMKKSSSAGKVETGYQSGFVNDFVDARQVDNKLMELASRFPDMVTVTTRDYKTEGYDGKETSLRGPAPLRYVRIGAPGQNDKAKDKKPGVLVMAAPHAREVVEPMTMLEAAEQLLVNYDPESKDPKKQEITNLVDSVDIYVIGASNPDGLNFAIHDDPMWRKTRSSIPGSKEKGVDCNRNYDYQWLPGDPSSQVYSGEKPFSEPETRNMAQVVDDHPNIRFVADFHSYGEQIRRPMGVKDPKDLARYKQYQKRMSDAIRSHRGTDYDLIESKVVNGSSDDYFYFKKGKFAFCIENGQAFRPELPEALQVKDENVNCVMELLRIARDEG